MKKIIITVLTTVAAMVVAAFMGLYMLLGGSLENVAQTVRLISTMSFVKSQYVDDVPLVQLVDGAIDGMVKSLGDKHSIYMDDENFKAFMQQTEGSFGGVGIVMGFPKDGTCQVMSVIEDTPSAQAGIQPKDEIIKIDGTDVSNMQPDEMAAKVRGDEGTQVVLTVRRQGQEDFDVTLTRAIIPLTTAKGTMIDGTNIGYIRIASFSENTGKEFAKEIQNRDPRLADNIDEESGLRLNGVAAVYAASGYYANRYVNKDLINKPGGMSSTNTTDAPVMKLNEVLMNYIEAAAELADLGQYTLTQADFDKTINAIRDRQSTQMPHITLAGNALKVNGVEINDPDRDATVTPIIWEIRRERRVELAYEGLRFNDLRRWGKLEYADMTKNKKLNMGAWINKADYPENADALAKITLCDENGHIVTGNEGYIMPITEVAKMRVMADKDYLYPIPVDQITMYENHGFKLTQNPGW